MSILSGWFPDPAGTAGRQRWWDGTSWTRWLSTDPSAPAPHELPTATPVRDDGVPDPNVRWVWPPWAVAAVIVVVLAALIGVGGTVALTSERIRTGPAVAPPPPSAAPAVSYRASSRTITVEELRMVLPGEPYRCANAPIKVAPFASSVSCDVLIHQNYSGSKDWYATAGVGLLPEAAVIRGDLKQTGERLFLSLRRQFFSRQVTSLEKFVATPTDLSTPGKSIVLSGEIRYRIKGLPSSYDRMFLALVELRSGRHAAFYSARPGDAPESALAALDASLDTLSAR